MKIFVRLLDFEGRFTIPTTIIKSTRVFTLVTQVSTMKVTSVKKQDGIWLSYSCTYKLHGYACAYFIPFPLAK